MTVFKRYFGRGRLQMKREEATIKKRKTRSDKKRDVKPTISLELKNCIYRLSYVVNIPVKNIVEVMCEKGLQSRPVIEYLAQFFRRDYQFLSTIYMGDYDRESLQNKWQPGKNERVATRFSSETYEKINDLSDALDVTPSKATSLLLDASVRNADLLNTYIEGFLKSEDVDSRRLDELNKVFSYLKKNNPYNEELTWYSILSMLYDEVYESTTNIKDSVHNWLEKYK